VLALLRRLWFRSPEKVFERIYRRSAWGEANDFFSGHGSHDPRIVEPYVEAVRTFLAHLPERANVVDLGCGDFNVGRRLRDLCATYTACDVVAPLIARNREAFAAMDVRFMQLDIVANPLPPGDVAFVRQVLQHLDNGRIAAVAAKLPQYRWLIVTEHLPLEAHFPPNCDKPLDAGIRIQAGSGVVLTAPPFGLQALEERVLCAPEGYGGRIVTMLYRMH
jgi:hypothetical protein